MLQDDNSDFKQLVRLLEVLEDDVKITQRLANNILNKKIAKPKSPPPPRIGSPPPPRIESEESRYREIPRKGFLRLKQILGDKKANPPIPPLIPVSNSTWYEGMKTGRFPKSVRLGFRSVAWKAEDIRRYIDEHQ